MKLLLIVSMNLVGAVRLKTLSLMAKYLIVIVNCYNQSTKLRVVLLIELTMSYLWMLGVKNVKV
nr:MAG TPA: hypothetical protein [Caudoviricetes sp.]